MQPFNRVQVKVVRLDPDTNKFIVEYKGKRYQLASIPFQRREELPDFLNCIATINSETSIYLQQDYEQLVRSKYNENDIVEFSIKHAYPNYYLLEDEYGFTTQLSREEHINPALTPKVKCLIRWIKGKKIRIKLLEALSKEEQGFSVTDEELEKLYGETVWDKKTLCDLLLGDISNDLFDSECHRWIVQTAAGKEKDNLLATLGDIRSKSLSILQESDILKHCQDNERDLLEGRFTDIIEQTGFYIDSIGILERGEAEKFVNQILTILQRSGFLYHPSENFYTMLCVFLRDFNLLERKIHQILQVLKSQSITLWTRKPFGKLWVKLLEYYISSMNNDPDRLDTDHDSVKTMIQVLTMEMNMGNEGLSDLYDVNLNRSILYRLASRQNVNSPIRMLDQAFNHNIGNTNDQPVVNISTDDADIIANYIANQISEKQDEQAYNLEYVTNDATISIRNGQILLMANNVKKDNVYSPLPPRLNLWKGLSVKLSEKPSTELRSKNRDNIPYYKDLWRFIDQSLFGKQGKDVSTKNKIMVGSQVTIIITRQMENWMFECRVVEKDYEGWGVIDAAKDITPYFPGKIDITDFMYNGFPLLLNAYVTEIKDDNSYVFAMRNYIHRFMVEYRQDNLNYNSHLICLVNNIQPGATRVPAISSEGLSVSIGVDENTKISDLKKGSFVEVYDIKPGPIPYTNVTFLKNAEDERFSTSDAFHQLMVNYADKGIYIEQEEEIDEESVQLEDSHVTELMRTIEEVANNEENYIKGYNYLSFCRIIAKMQNNNERVTYYENKLRLLEILNDFAINEKVDLEKIEKFKKEDADILEQNTALRHDFMQLQIIGWLNTEDHQEELCRISCDEGDSDLQQMAALVLSHNYVKRSGLQQEAAMIFEKIRALLNLRKNQSNKKYYGREDFHTEFKTSIMFPENSMKVAPQVQTVKVMQEICAFLNAEGGKLYLGVNDMGYEAGLEEDLKLKNFEGNLDKYRQYVEGNIFTHLGQEAAHYVHANYDDTAKEHVLVLNIEPCPTPISIGGEFFERMGTSARHVNDSYRSTFLDNRKLWAEMHQPIKPDLLQEPIKQEVELSPTKTTPIAPTPISETTTNGIPTSQRRNNVLHDYESGYINSEAIICLIDDDKYKVVDEDDWQPARLKLNVHETDLNAYLILVYGNENIVKVPIQEILERDRGRIYKRYSESKLLFASIGNDKDFLVIGFIDGKGNHYIRFDTIDTLEEGKMLGSGNTIMDVANDGIHYCEIVEAAAMPDDVPYNTKRKTLGISLKTRDGKRLIDELLPGCKA